MPVPTETIWQLDPHTVAKHEILKRYLQRWFPILNKHHGKIVYVDGFCGPGRYAGGEPGSPLIALDVAANHRKALTGEIVFWFIDERPDRIEHLKSELQTFPRPPHFRVVAESGIFHEKLRQQLDTSDRKGTPSSPTFVFIDPFGFSGIPFALIERLLRKPSCEVLITFMVDSINRFLKHPNEEIIKHIEELFGTPNCFQIAQQSSDRIGALRDMYQQQLKRVARYVRYFEMRDYNNRPQYLLFFASNNSLGHIKIKEAMWAVDSEGSYRFSDATNPHQQILFYVDFTEELWGILKQRYAGKEVKTDEIFDFVNNETAFLETHVKATLKKHLDEPVPPHDRVKVREIKADGKKWRYGTFPLGVSVTFPA